jgi:hypothetical protein
MRLLVDCGYRVMMIDLTTNTSGILPIAPFVWSVLTLDPRTGDVYAVSSGTGVLIWDGVVLSGVAECAQPTGIVIDQRTAGAYLSCAAGLTTLSSEFRCQTGNGRQWSLDGCVPCQPGSARSAVDADDAVTLTPICRPYVPLDRSHHPPAVRIAICAQRVVIRIPTQLPRCVSHVDKVNIRI